MCSALVEVPTQPPADGIDKLRREFPRRTFQHLAQSLSLILPGHEKNNMRRGVEHGKRQGQSLGFQAGGKIRNDPSLVFIEPRAPGKSDAVCPSGPMPRKIKSN